MATWRSDRHRIGALLLKATDAGLEAAARQVQGRVRVALRGGYTSGAFVTGAGMNAVTVGAPEWRGRARAVAVGTNMAHSVYWELGHFNTFTRRYERQERWRPALNDSAPDAQAAFARVFGRVWQAGGGGPTTGGAYDMAAD